MKTITKMPPLEDYQLRTMANAQVGRVDRKNRRILGVAVLQAGKVNDRRTLKIDDATLAKVIQIGNGGTRNLKARWTHPNMSSDGLGKYLGRWANFRLSDDGQTVLADLQLSPIAFKKADPELGMSRGEWVLDMAENDHDAFGVSLAPSRMDDAAMEREEDEEGYQPYRPLGLEAVDVVDSPAATRGGLFGGMALSVETAPAVATEVMNQLFPDAEPEVVKARALGFLDKYLLSRFGEGVATTGAEPMATDTKAPEAVTREDLAKLNEEMLSAIDEKLATLGKPVEPAQDELAQAREDERKRCKELYALAANAGLPQAKADEWIEKNLSVLEAKAVVADLAIAGNGLSKDAGEQEPDKYAKFRKEFHENRAELARFDITDEDAYVRSRCRDEGMELPPVK